MTKNETMEQAVECSDSVFLETRENVHKRTEVGSCLLGKGGRMEVTSPQTEVIFYNMCMLQADLGQVMR